eukprot:3088503-Prymnesium_polylepis.1
MAFLWYPEDRVSSEAASACVAAFAPTSVVASYIYVEISVAAAQDNTTPLIPTWMIILTNSPFVLVICAILAVESSHRKTSRHSGSKR